MFKKKSENYEKYRPNYPANLINYLDQNKILKKTDIIAEFGSGTGKLTELLINKCSLLYCIEPEEEMYNFLNKKYANSDKIRLTNDYAESTSITNDSINLVIAAQSFHLFNAEKAKNEFYRILKNKGFIIFIWYNWDMNYMVSFEIRNLFKKYREIQNQKKRLNINPTFINQLFYPNIVYHAYIDIIRQKFNKDEFVNSMLSSSFACTIEDFKNYTKFINDSLIIFDKYSMGGHVEYSFILEIYYTKIENKN